jgi:hypothetical protein
MIDRGPTTGEIGDRLTPRKRHGGSRRSGVRRVDPNSALFIATMARSLRLEYRRPEAKCGTSPERL